MDGKSLEPQYHVVIDALEPLSAHSDREVDQRLDQARAALSQSAFVNAYANLNTQQDEKAVSDFQRAFAFQSGNASQYADAGYAAQRAGNNVLATQWLDYAADKSGDAAQKYAYRSQVAELNRQWGADLSLGYQSNSFDPVTRGDVLQAGAELYWRPSWGYDNGRIFQMFVRAYETLYDGSELKQKGRETAQGSIGASYKPFSEHNLVGSVERLYRIGELADQDWLVRLGYSRGAGGDWQPALSDVTYWNVYAEAGRYLDASRTIASFDARYGRSWAVGDNRWRVMPHWVLSGDRDNQALEESSMGTGPAISLKHWFADSPSDASKGGLEFTLQYRAALIDANRSRGLGGRFSLWF